MTFNYETSLGAYDPMLNVTFVFLLASVTVMVFMFAHKKYCVKESQETKMMKEAEREIMKTEKERREARRIEETGYSERDEYDDNDSDDGGE